MSLFQVRGGRGGGPARGPSRGQAGESKKREAILDLSKYLNQTVKVEFVGGRVVSGTLKGYDQLLNLVLDNLEEEATTTSPARKLGLVVLRGTSLVVLSPADG